MLSQILPYLIALSIYLVYVIVLCKLIYEDRDPSDTAFWLIVITSLPLFGIVIFFFFGRDWRKGTKRSRYEQSLISNTLEKSTPGIFSKYSVYNNEFLKREDWLTKVARLNYANDSSPVLPANSIDILPSGKLGFKSLLSDLRAANESVHLEFFIWEKDELTSKITDILLERLRSGVEVRIKYDFLGCIGYKKEELKILKKAGARVSADITDIGRVNYRNHRKIAVVDGRIGYTGGINIGQEYIDGGDKYPAWRDTFVRVTGPIVLDLQRVFATRWLVVNKENLFSKRYFPDTEFDKTAKPAQINVSSSDYQWSTARNSFLLAILEANKRVYIQSPYFIPDRALFAALETASLSGVDVRLIMTGWPDKKIAWDAAQTFFEKLLKAGMKIYYYEEGFMHAKTMLVDDTFTSIGSTNFDVRSFTLQKEAGLFFYDEKTATRHLEIFKKDLKKCREFTLEDYQRLSKLKRMRNSLSKLLSNLF